MSTTHSQTDSATASSNKRKRTDDNHDASKSAIEDNQQPASGDLESNMRLAPKGWLEPVNTPPPILNEGNYESALTELHEGLEELCRTSPIGEKTSAFYVALFFRAIRSLLPTGSAMVVPSRKIECGEKELEGFLDWIICVPFPPSQSHGHSHSGGLCSSCFLTSTDDPKSCAASVFYVMDTTPVTRDADNFNLIGRAFRKMQALAKGPHKTIRGVVMNQFHFTFLYVKALDGPSKPENCERYLSIPNRLTIEDMSKEESISRDALEFVVSAMTYLALHSHDEIANDAFFEITSDSYQCSESD